MGRLRGLRRAKGNDSGFVRRAFRSWDTLTHRKTNKKMGSLIRKVFFFFCQVMSHPTRSAALPWLHEKKLHLMRPSDLFCLILDLVLRFYDPIGARIVNFADHGSFYDSLKSKRFHVFYSRKGPLLFFFRSLSEPIEDSSLSLASTDDAHTGHDGQHRVGSRQFRVEGPRQAGRARRAAVAEGRIPGQLHFPAASAGGRHVADPARRLVVARRRNRSRHGPLRYGTPPIRNWHVFVPLFGPRFFVAFRAAALHSRPQ